MWEPQPLTPLWASTACYRNNFTFYPYLDYINSVADSASLNNLTVLRFVFCSHLSYFFLVGLLYQPRMIDDDECGAVCGMRIGRGNRSTGRKPAPVPFYRPQFHLTLPGLEPVPPRWEARDSPEL
jgi:hypothetical protein